MDAAMDAVTESYNGASNWIKRHYKTGRKRKTYYSMDNMNVGTYLKTIGKLRTYWLRRVESGSPFTHVPYRGQTRNGKHAGGQPVQLIEHKVRLVQLAKDISFYDFGNNKEGMHDSKNHYEALLLHNKRYRTAKTAAAVQKSPESSRTSSFQLSEQHSVWSHGAGRYWNRVICGRSQCCESACVSATCKR